MNIEEYHCREFVKLRPSRHTNPFATCWTRPGALPFQFAAGASAQQLMERLAAANWRGEIVGPHGSGKSTLLATLHPLLEAAGRDVAILTLRAGQRRLPASVVRTTLAAPRPLLIIDGYEQLTWLNRRRLQWRCRRASAGLVVTSHLPTGLPTLYCTSPSREMAEQLVSALTQCRPSPVATEDITASLAIHGSNLREFLFALYDRHEALVRR